MIAIVNVTKGGIKPGFNDYEVRINSEVICTFRHKREKGLAHCLAAAAIAVIEYDQEEGDRKIKALIEMMSDENWKKEKP